MRKTAMTTDRQRRPRFHQRSGAILSAELLFVLPLFLLVVFSAVEFAALSYAQSQVASAAQAAVQLAARSNADNGDVARRAHDILGPAMGEHGRIHIQPGSHTHDLATVRLRVRMEDAAPDLLWPIGFGLRGRHLEATARMARETDALPRATQRQYPQVVGL